jgi:hypothetical protein
MSIYTQLTPQWLKDTFLLGVDLTLDDGTDYPDVIYTQSINASIKHVESDLGISIEPFSVVQEGHDAERQGRFSYWPFRLDNRPIMSFQNARIRFGSFEPVDIPTSWIKSTSTIHGQINLIPSEESLGSYFFRAGVPLMGGYGIYENREYIPSYFEFDYTAGFEERSGQATIPQGSTEVSVTLSPRVLLSYTVETTNASQTSVELKNKSQEGFTLYVDSAPSEDLVINWTMDTLPADLKQAIGIKSATLLLLHVAGDLILGAGIASQSLSVDGLSTSVGTTSSAMYSGYSSRSEALDKQYKILIQALRSQYKIVQFGVV